MENKRETLLIALYSGPGTGKSTTMAGVFAELKLNDITTYYGNSNKNYINYNGKLMRAFNTTNIFTHLNNLSSHNYSIIKKIIDENLSSINKKLVVFVAESAIGFY
jgi:uridine kinase